MEKILVILDHNYNKDPKIYKELTNRINEVYGNSYEIVFKLFDPVQTHYEFVPQNIQSAIDSDTIQTSDDDYACVIVDGPAAYFWLQSFYSGPLIAINPVIDIYTVAPYDADENKELKFSRSFQTDNIICIVSNEHRDFIQEYDNAFLDTTVILADENLKDIEDFWSLNSSFDQVFQYMVNKNE